MKKYQKILSILGLLILFVGGSLFLKGKFTENDTSIDTAYLSVSAEDDQTYYLNKQSKNIEFEIEAEELDYNLLDDEGNHQEAIVKETKEGTYLIKAPNKVYKEGKSYRLELNDGNYFVDKDIQEAETLIFNIKKDPIARYTFSEELIELKDPIIELEDNVIEFKNYDAKIDDIIFTVNENQEYVAYKITNILTDNKAEVAIPAIDEIYDELEVYGEYQINFEDNDQNSNTEAKLVQDIQNSDFFDQLIKSAYASDNDNNEKIKIEHEQNIKNNTLKSKVTLTFEPTKDGLFNNKDLVNTTVELVLTNDYDLSVFVDIDNIKDWNVSTIQNAKFNWELDIASKNKLSLDKEVINEIVQIIDEEKESFTALESLFDEFTYRIPNVPGLTLHLEPAIRFNMDLLANLNMENTYATSNILGIVLKDEKFDSYASFKYETDGLESSMEGDLDWQSGLVLEISAKLFDSRLLDSSVAHFTIQPEIGLYIDSAVLGKISSTNENSVNGYFESGLYVDGEVDAEVKYLLGELKYNQKWDVIKYTFDPFSFGNNIVPIGLMTNDSEVIAKDLRFNSPAFSLESYDLKKKEKVEQKLNAADILYSLENDEQLTVENNQLLIPETDEEKVFVTASYTDENNEIHYLDFPLTIFENLKYPIDHEDFNPPMTFIFNDSLNPYLIHPMISFTFNPDQTFSGSILTGVQDMYYNGAPYDGNIFTGEFSEINKVDSLSYLIKLDNMSYQYDDNQFWDASPENIFGVEENASVRAMNPPMIFKDSTEFYLHAPGKPIENFPDIVIDEFNDESLIYNHDILESIPGRYKKNNSLDTWTLQLKDSNFQDSIILYHID